MWYTLYNVDQIIYNIVNWLTDGLKAKIMHKIEDMNKSEKYQIKL